MANFITASLAQTQHPNLSKSRVNLLPTTLTILPRRVTSKKKMLPISSNFGLPICLAGISSPLPLSQEMEDHERRRETMKRKKFQEILQLHEMIRAQNIEASGNGKSTVAANEFSPCISLPCTAKAA